MDVFPGVKLHSENPVQRAKDRMLVEVFNKVIMPLMRIWRQERLHCRGQGEAVDSVHGEPQAIRERARDSWRGRILLSCQEHPGWLDYMIWPWFERIDAFFETYLFWSWCMNYPQLFFHHIIQEPGVKFQREEFPVLSSWMERIIIFIHSLCKLHKKFVITILKCMGSVPWNAFGSLERECCLTRQWGNTCGTQRRIRGSWPQLRQVAPTTTCCQSPEHSWMLVAGYVGRLYHCTSIDKPESQVLSQKSQFKIFGLKLS